MNNIFSQEIVGILKIGFAQLLAGVIFVSSGILITKEGKKFGFLLFVIGLLLIIFPFLFDRVIFNENNIPGKLNILPMIFSVFMLGIPQVLLGIPLIFIGISKLSNPESKRFGILFLMLASALTFTFVWSLIFFVGSDM